MVQRVVSGITGKCITYDCSNLTFFFSGGSMDKKSDRTFGSLKCVLQERTRCVLYLITVAFLVLSIVYISVAFVSMKQQLSEVKKELRAIKDSRTSLGEKDPPSRRKRRASNSQISELVRRIALLESG